MEARFTRLEHEVAAIKVDVALIKATGATKTDIAELKSELKSAIAESRATTILWVSTVVVIGQILPAILKFFLS